MSFVLNVANAIHKARHATGGADAITPADIGADVAGAAAAAQSAAAADATDKVAGVTVATLGAITPASVDTKIADERVTERANQMNTYLTPGTADATYVSILKVAPSPGRKIGFGGDSMTAGTGASTSNRRYSVIVPMLAGTRWFSRNPANSGVGGNTSALLLARISADLLGDAATQHIHVQIGTNDAGSGVTPTAFAANIVAIHALVKAKGMSMSIGLVPPRTLATGTASSRRLETAYNEWIGSWAGPAAVTVADTRSPLVDPATGYLSDSLSFDGIHPNDAGHLLMAKAIAAALSAKITKTPGARIINPDTNKMSNGTMTGGTASTPPTGWFKHPSSSGTAPVQRTVADASGMLAEGVWYECEVTAAAATVIILLGPAITCAGVFAETDSVIVEAQVQLEDVLGYAAAYAAGTASCVVQLTNQSMGQIGGQPVLTDFGAETPGPARFAALTPSAASATGMNMMLTLTLPIGVHVKARLGAVSFRNGTTEGAVTIPS